MWSLTSMRMITQSLNMAAQLVSSLMTGITISIFCHSTIYLSVNLSICLPLCLSVCQSLSICEEWLNHLWIGYPANWSGLRWRLYLSIYLSLCLSIYLTINVMAAELVWYSMTGISIYQSMYLSTYLLNDCTNSPACLTLQKNVYKYALPI